MLLFFHLFLKTVVNNLPANSAYDFEELAGNLKSAFSMCKVVEALDKFTNFSETVNPFLNVASDTPGCAVSYYLSV
jgi:hypothetical protein